MRPASSVTYRFPGELDHAEHPAWLKELVGCGVRQADNA